jgi:DTW domain-containing protein YfiP
MVGNTWSYVSKSEWKAVTRKPMPVIEVKEETISEKQLKRKKNEQNRSK